MGKKIGYWKLYSIKLMILNIFLVKTEWKKHLKNDVQKILLFQVDFTVSLMGARLRRLFISSDQIKKRKEKQSTWTIEYFFWTCTWTILGESINTLPPISPQNPSWELDFLCEFSIPNSNTPWFFIIYAPFPIKQSRACFLLICLLLKCSSEHFVGL